jgi:hypothetical protein
MMTMKKITNNNDIKKPSPITNNKLGALQLGLHLNFKVVVIICNSRYFYDVSAIKWVVVVASNTPKLYM